jgi:predicted amidohydrolase
MLAFCHGTMNRIAQVGFHSPKTRKAPLETLRATLKVRQDQLSGTLLVLPEAFNLEDYNLNSNIRKYPRIISELRQLAEDFDIAIVTGLIIPGPTECETHNSAYLVDANGHELMCHTMLSDTQGPYRPCQTGCDGHNAIKYLNISLWCLICMDAYEENANRDPRRNAFGC